MGVYSRHLRPRLHDRLLDDAAVHDVRARVCAGLSGDVLEIGFGSGLNLGHLPPEVTGVWAVEPSATALRLAAPRREASPVPVHLAGDDAQVLPFPDHRFDAALCTWVLCSVPDRRRALAEVARVLRPGGLVRRRSGHPRGRLPRLRTAREWCNGSHARLRIWCLRA